MLRGRFWLAVVLLAFVLGASIVNPIGDFALDDDFAYGKTVLNFSQGNFRIHQWISATVIFQTLLGTAFVKIFGFSFTVLRFVSILTAISGAVAAYLILREIGLPDSVSAFGTAVLVFNPLYFSKAFNFHSDVYFMSLMLFSLLFYVKAVKRNNDDKLLLAGSIFSVFSILVRQNGLFIPPAVAAYMWLNRRNARFSIKQFIIVAIIPLISFLAYSYWFYFIHGSTESSSLMSQYDFAHLSDLATRLIPYRIFAIFMYMGMLLLPLTISNMMKFHGFYSGLERTTRMLFWAFIAAGIASMIFMHRYYGKVLFYLPTIIHSTGIGPAYLQGTKHPQFPVLLLFALSLISLISAAIIAVSAWKKSVVLARKIFRQFPTSDLQNLVYFVGVGQIAFLMILLAVFDRYLLPLYFPIIALMLKERPSIPKAGLVVLLLVGLFAVAGTQDYLEWNRAKSSAISELMKSGVPADKIDGGFEHAAWNFYEFSKANPDINIARKTDPGWIRDYFPVIDSVYVVSFSPLEGYEVVSKRPYYSLLAGKQQIFTLKRVKTFI
ncbi:glycosyltransferase family 39 protein [Candidatus Woesearchaeota archaeon]|nr:glycosyltransferase family 39 protein [Candidatus Woesearchaeota archaeon]